VGSSSQPRRRIATKAMQVAGWRRGPRLEPQDLPLMLEVLAEHRPLRIEA
jgi:hypothetical protein